MSTCPLCQTRKARRACPALGRKICAVCCGTKRQVEISCPADCTYLVASQAHPPAVVQRRFERDLTFLMPFLQPLTQAQFEIMRVLMALTRHQAAGAMPPLLDRDVAEGASTVAATLETAGRGIIYQHQAQSGPAQRLAQTLEGFVRQLASDAGAHAAAVERDSAVALRQIARAAEAAAGALAEDGDAAFVKLLGRVAAAEPETGGDAPPPRLIIPG